MLGVIKSRYSSVVSIVLGYGMDDRGSVSCREFSLRHRVQTASGAHPAPYPEGTGDSFLGGKAAGVLSCPLTPI